LVMFLGTGVFASSGNTFFLMEWMAGGSLADLFYDVKSTVSFNEIVMLLKDTCEALAYLHLLHKSVHLDVKGANILLSLPIEGGSRRAKLSDFGMAKTVSHGKRHLHLAHSKESKHSSSSASARKAAGWYKKMVGGYIGTSRFMAPELMDRKATISPAADIYSFGVVMWTGLSRRKPWEGLSDEEIFKSVKNGQRPTLPVAAAAARGAEAYSNYENLMRCCWDDSIESRPLIDVVSNKIQEILELSAGLERKRRKSYRTRVVATDGDEEKDEAATAPANIEMNGLV